MTIILWASSTYFFSIPARNFCLQVENSWWTKKWLSSWMKRNDEPFTLYRIRNWCGPSEYAELLQVSPLRWSTLHAHCVLEGQILHGSCYRESSFFWNLISWSWKLKHASWSWECFYQLYCCHFCYYFFIVTYHCTSYHSMVFDKFSIYRNN